MMHDFVHPLAATLLVTGLVLLARVLFSRVTRFDVEAELTEADNPAVGVALFGFLAGLLIVFAGLLATDSDLEALGPTEMAWDLAELGIYGLLSIALLLFSGVLNDRLILHRFENRKELVDDHNSGTGAVLCGSYVATGCVLAAAVGGRVEFDALPAGGALQIIGFEVLVAVALFVLGQLVLIIFGHLYQWVTPYDVHAAIAEDTATSGGNLAAGLAFGGNLAAMGIILWGGAHHDFESWTDSLTQFAIAAGLGLVLIPAWRWVVDHVMLPKADLAHEISVDRNINAALLEVVTVCALAVAIALQL